jgi:hypothetical protein
MFAGSQGDKIDVALAVADGTYPEHYLAGVVADDILQDTLGDVVQLGVVEGIDTSDFSLGDILYADPVTPGGLCLTPGAWGTPIAAVTRVHANTGRILVRCIPGGGAGGGIVSSETAPENPTPDMAWFDTTTGDLSIWYDDGDSAQWVQISSGPIADTELIARVDDLEVETSSLDSRTTSLEGIRPVSIGGTGASSFASGSYLKGNGSSAISTQTGIPFQDLPSGTVIQQAHYTYNTYTNGSGTGWQDIHSGTRPAITAKRSDSHFIILASMNWLQEGTRRQMLRLKRNGTVIAPSDVMVATAIGSGWTQANHFFQWKDTTARTAGTTYTFSFDTAVSGGTWYYNYNFSGITGTSMYSIWEVIA